MLGLEKHTSKTMKPIITSALVIAIVILMPACDKKPNTAEPADRVKALEDEIARLKAAPPAAPKPVGELTRELAAAMLNKELAEPHIKEIEFKEGGFEQAERDGIFVQGDNFNPYYNAVYRFTGKGSALSNGLVKGDTKVSKGCISNFVPPLAERVTTVTGIALSPYPNVCEVQYTTQYIIPAGAEGMYQYIYSGSRRKAMFQKFDDGWRVVNK